MLGRRIKIDMNDCGKEDMQNLGDSIRSIRKCAGYSQQDLADCMLRDRTFLSKIELGGYGAPNIMVLNDIAKSLGYKLSITFEKEEEKKLADDQFLKSIISHEIINMESVRECIDAYCKELEEYYLGDNEDYYFGKCDPKTPEYIEYHRNVLNYKKYLEIKNLLTITNNEIRIYMDNPDDHFTLTSEWDDRIFILVTSSGNVGQDSYKLELIKEDYYNNERVLFTWSVTAPMDVLIAAINIRAGYLSGVSYAEVDITNKDTLMLSFDVNEDNKQYNLNEKLGYYRVMDAIDEYNSNNDDYYITYKFNSGASYTCSSMGFVINYKNVAWTFYYHEGNYVLSLRNGSKEKTMEFSFSTPEEVVSAIVKYS